MGTLLSSDAIRIGSRIFTRNRAIAAGLIVVGKDGETVLTAKGRAQINSAAAKVAKAADLDAAWRARQGLPPLDVEISEDGQIKPTRKPRVLKPKNVTHTGEEVTDAEVLAKIAAEADEKAKAFVASLAPVEGDGADG
jgi:hypothetical protein